jgi:DnaK suppressor protein
MNKAFLEKQKKKLEAEKEEIKGELKNITEKGEISNHFKAKYPHLGDTEEDNAEEVEEYIENLDLEGHLEDFLRNIKNALLRIKQKKYGICQRCGKKINKARLEAYPAATLCVRCQNQQEKRQIIR